MSGKDGYTKPPTYYGQDFGDGGNREPNDTLVNGEQHISRYAMASERH
jgi:hypothetical protein